MTALPKAPFSGVGLREPALQLSARPGALLHRVLLLVLQLGMLTPQLLLSSLQLLQLLAQLLGLLLGHLQAVGQVALLPIGRAGRGEGVSEATLPQGWRLD